MAERTCDVRCNSTLEIFTAKRLEKFYDNYCEMILSFITGGKINKPLYFI